MVLGDIWTPFGLEATNEWQKYRVINPNYWSQELITIDRKWTINLIYYNEFISYIVIDVEGEFYAVLHKIKIENRKPDSKYFEVVKINNWVIGKLDSIPLRSSRKLEVYEKLNIDMQFREKYITMQVSWKPEKEEGPMCEYQDCILQTAEFLIRFHNQDYLLATAGQGVKFD